MATVNIDTGRLEPGTPKLNGATASDGLAILAYSQAISLKRIADALDVLAGRGPLVDDLAALGDRLDSVEGALAQRLAKVEDRTAGMRTEREKLQAQADNTTETGS